MTDAPYILHYAPDNASLVVRLALEEIGAPYETRLVDRVSHAQKDPAYLMLNPNGLIPVLETPDGAIFETGAILLWLGDRHGVLGPAITTSERAEMLKWLFFLSNTLHPLLRQVFYPTSIVGNNSVALDALKQQSHSQIMKHLGTLDAVWSKTGQPLILNLYLAAMLRWLALYPKTADKSWFNLGNYPALLLMAETLEHRASVAAAVIAEGLGASPFTAPQPPDPPEGSAT